MAKRLWYIITWPSAILSIIFGSWLLVLAPYWLEQPWMHAKLGFVFLLVVYQFKTHFIFKELQARPMMVVMRLLGKVKVVTSYMPKILLVMQV